MISELLAILDPAEGICLANVFMLLLALCSLHGANLSTDC